MIDGIWLPKKWEGTRGIRGKAGGIGHGERKILPSVEPEDESMDTIVGQFVECKRRLRELPLEGLLFQWWRQQGCLLRLRVGLRRAESISNSYFTELIKVGRDPGLVSPGGVFYWVDWFCLSHVSSSAFKSFKCLTVDSVNDFVKYSL